MLPIEAQTCLLVVHCHSPVTKQVLAADITRTA